MYEPCSCVQAKPLWTMTGRQGDTKMCYDTLPVLELFEQQGQRTMLGNPRVLIRISNPRFVRVQFVAWPLEEWELPF